MPAGVSAFTYAKFTTAALLSMALGSQTVHLYYKPLQDIEELTREAQEKVLPPEIKELIKKTQEKNKE
jgi:hypothetical protein